MSSEKQRPLAHDDPAWAPARGLIQQRANAMVQLSGQPPLRPVGFEPRYTRRGRGKYTAAGYGWMGTDRIGVNLPKMFESPQIAEILLTDPKAHGVIDGIILHELGHRRRRISMRLFITPELLVALVTLPILVFVLVSYLSSDDYPGWYLWTAQLVLAALWLAMRVPVWRWHERQADDYVLDVGGADIWDRLSAGLSKSVGSGTGKTLVHASVTARDARQRKRLAQATGKGRVTPA